MSCIDGFVIAVPAADKQKFIEHARQLDPMFIERGAIRVIEGWGDDVPDGKVTDFRRAVQATADETVACSWIEWPDKSTRDAAMKRVMEDPRMDPSTPGNPPMPFDGKRMGVYRGGRDGVPAFVEVAAPTDDALHALLQTLITRLKKPLMRRGVRVEDMGQTYLAEPDADGDEARTLRRLQAAAVTHRIAFGSRVGQQVLTLRGAMPREGTRPATQRRRPSARRGGGPHLVRQRTEPSVVDGRCWRP